MKDRKTEKTMILRITKRTVAIALMLCTLFVFITGTQYFFFNFSGEEAQRLKAFYLEKKNSLDIVVLGSSEVKLDYSAPEVYRETGISSFPYCYSVNPVPLWKYELADIERLQHPSVLVVEINGAIYKDSNHVHSKGAFYKLTEGMPISMNKIKMVRDICSQNDDMDIISSLFPFFRYHGQWNDVLDNNHYKNNIMQVRMGYAPLRGAQSPLYFSKFPTEEPYPRDYKTDPLNPDAEKALRDFLKTCDSSDIEHIIFVQFPHLLTYEKSYARNKRYNRAAEIIKEHGYEYVDFNRMAEDIGLDPATDYYDSEHMTASGQRKLSAYLGRYLKDKYDLPPSELTPSVKDTWNASSEYIDRFYKYYDDYIKTHEDEKYKEVDFNLKDSCKTMDLINNK